MESNKVRYTASKFSTLALQTNSSRILVRLGSKPCNLASKLQSRWFTIINANDSLRPLTLESHSEGLLEFKAVWGEDKARRFGTNPHRTDLSYNQSPAPLYHPTVH